ncbi:hypothetical protein DSECCO2_99770 [anaerobic digester metagenome]
MSLIPKKTQHPVFTVEGCKKVVTFLHADFADCCPGIYENEKASWTFVQMQINILAKNSAIFGSNSAFGYLIGASNSIRWNDSVSHALYVANHISVLSVIDDFVWRSGFKDAVEGALLLEWPSVVHVVTQDPETRIVTVNCRHSGGVKGKFKKMVYGYPSPREVLNRLHEFFGDPYFVKYESAIVGDRVKLRVFYDVTENSVEEAVETDNDQVSDFRRQIIRRAWLASGNT